MLSVVTSTAGNLVTKFYYDGDGARVKETLQIGTGAVLTTTLYAGAIEVISTTQRITRTYYAAGSSLMAMRVVTSTGGNTLYYFATDHLGSTSVTLDSAGNVVSELRYYAYGQTRYTSGATPTDRQFTGQYNEGSALGGLYFLNARLYDPLIGRFISADTIVPEPGYPQALNRFSFVYNNPLKYIDPSGYCGEVPAQGVSQEHHERLCQLYHESLRLSDLVKSGKLTDVEALAMLFEFAAPLYLHTVRGRSGAVNWYDTAGFVEELGLVVGAFSYARGVASFAGARIGPAHE